MVRLQRAWLSSSVLMFLGELLGLEQPTHKLKLIGLRAFSLWAPHLWHSLPFESKSSASVSIFKAKLKTCLFRQAYFYTFNFSFFLIFRIFRLLIFRFLGKWMSNFTKLHLAHEIFRILPVQSQFLWNLTFIFSDFHEKYSLVLLQMIYYIFSRWKMYKRMQYSLNYSGTRFLSTEN